MENLKKLLGKTFNVIIFSGVLYTTVMIVFYIVGMMYWHGVLNTLGIDYSFVRMDDYNLNIAGGFLSFNASYIKLLYMLIVLCLICFIVFVFSDVVYWILRKFKSRPADDKSKLYDLTSLLFFLAASLFFSVMLMGSFMIGSYNKGKEDALAIIKDQSATTSGNKEKDVVSIKKKIQLKTGEELSGQLIICSQDQCIIYSQNKAFTIEKDKIESLVSEFDLKK